MCCLLDNLNLRSTMLVLSTWWKSTRSCDNGTVLVCMRVCVCKYESRLMVMCTSAKGCVHAHECESKDVA